LRIHA